jgi:Tol biopolymer transport system component
VQGGSADLSDLVVNVSLGLNPSDPLEVGDTRFYQVTSANGPSPGFSEVTVNPDGTPMNLCDGALFGPNTSALYHPISADGSKIFFEAKVAPCASGGRDLYARIGASQTVDISEPSVNDECTTSACRNAQNEGADFRGASADGSKVYFTSDQQLTDNATQDATFGDSSEACLSNSGPNGCNLYEYDFNRPAGHNLVDVSAGDMSGLGPQVEGVVAVSDSGSLVYFVAASVLSSQPNSLGQSASAGAQNLYVYDATTGAVRYIAQVPDDNVDGELKIPADITPDGSHLVFSTAAQLTPDDQNQAVDVYEYDFATGGLWRVSVGHDGQDQNGNGGGQDAIASPPESGLNRVTHVVSADGQEVVFTTARPLQNGVQPGSTNVYEWHDGEVSLVSGGAPTNANVSPGIDASGQSITFASDQGLVPSDTDGLIDIYDVRVDGGFPAPAVTPPGCSGDPCQGPPAAAPPPPPVATITFNGPGNPTPSKPKVRTRLVRGTRFTVAIRVPGAGRIKLSGTGIHAASRSVSRAGTYRIRASLTRAYRRLLSHRRELRLWLRATYAARAGSTSSVTFAIRLARPPTNARLRHTVREAALKPGGAR